MSNNNNTKGSTMEFTSEQLEAYVTIRAAAIAQSMFNEFKKTLKTPTNGTQRKAIVLATLSESELSGKRKQVFNVVAKNPCMDRHEILDILTKDMGTEISPGTISARLNELETGGLVEVVATRTGRFGKTVSLYKAIA